MSEPVAEPKQIDCDFAIVGSAIASTILGTILASRGHKVVLIEKGHHPKFAIGESTIPQTSLMLLSLGLRYGIPEFQQLSSFEQASQSVSRNCGKKSNFGFIFQRPGRSHDRSECHQLGVARRDFSETHFYRQDIDSHLLFTSIRYGCQVLQQTDIVDVDMAGDAVTIRTDRKVRIRARCLVDGSGYDSLLARKLALRETPTRVKARSRTLFVHMVDVQPFDRCVTESEDGLGKLAAWHEGTLHHIFRDGWMWVIPFNNHPAAMNPVCSVGLQLDPELRPKPGNMDPFEEFQATIEDYPEIRAQFRDAKPVRNWVSSGRLQYSTSSNVGDRWCLLSHSGGFVDPLFSRGLSNTVEVLNVAATTLLAAARDDDFSTARLMPIETVRPGGDRRKRHAGSRRLYLLQDFGLWNAWFRISGPDASLWHQPLPQEPGGVREHRHAFGLRPARLSATSRRACAGSSGHRRSDQLGLCRDACFRPRPDVGGGDRAHHLRPTGRGGEPAAQLPICRSNEYHSDATHWRRRSPSIAGFMRNCMPREECD